MGRVRWMREGEHAKGGKPERYKWWEIEKNNKGMR
jgi:hypothetical protein